MRTDHGASEAAADAPRRRSTRAPCKARPRPAPPETLASVHFRSSAASNARSSSARSGLRPGWRRPRSAAGAAMYRPGLPRPPPPQPAFVPAPRRRVMSRRGRCAGAAPERPANARACWRRVRAPRGSPPRSARRRRRSSPSPRPRSASPAAAPDRAADPARAVGLDARDGARAARRPAPG